MPEHLSNEDEILQTQIKPKSSGHKKNHRRHSHISNKLREFFTMESNVNVNIFNGIALAISTNLVNPYFAKFAERLGATDYQIAYLNSLPAFISLFALIPGAILIDVLGNKLNTTKWIMLINKFFYLIIAFVPFIHFVSKPWLFVILIALMNLPGSVYSMGYQSSIGDIFKPSERGLAMSLRNKYSDLIRLLITFISGLLLSLPKTEHDVILLYQILFIVSFFIGLWEVHTFSKFTVETTVSDRASDQFKRIIHAFTDSLKFIVKDSSFKRFLFASLLFYFGWQMGWPLFNIYTINKLGANEMWLSIISIAGGIASILTATHWAKFADKRGNTLTAFIATFGMSITPFLYVLSDSLFVLVLFNLLIGFSITGTVLVLFNLLLETTPATNRTTIISIYNTLIALSATIAPIVGVYVMEITNLDISLMITGGLRFVGCFAFLWMSTKHIRSTE